MRASTRALVLFAVACPALAELYTAPDQLPSRTYDYVIIGSGAGGAPVANRLSEDPKVSVLLLEAGENINSEWLMEVPLYAPPVVTGGTLNWNYKTDPQPELHDNAIPYLRGHVLGGTTSVNYMIHNTGPIDDWEHYARLANDKGWSWKAIQKYFHRAERMVPPADGRDTTGEWDPSIHGKEGIVGLTLPGYKTALDQRVLALMKEKPKEFPFVLDQNSGRPLGTGWAQLRINNGSRDSSATSYLGPQFLARKNLNVLLNAQAVKLVKTGTRGKRSVWRGVEINGGVIAPHLTLLARKEVILSAGVINTPQILMLSGIGNKTELEKLGIHTELDLPSVGKNMSDHPLLLNTWKVNAGPDEPTYDTLWTMNSYQDEQLYKWRAQRKGPLTNTVSNLIGWHRIPDDHPIFKTEGDSSTGPTAPHFELIHYSSFFAVRGIIPRPPGNYLSIFTVLASAASRGKVYIISKNPSTPPHIDPGLYTNKFDLAAMAEAVKKADSVVNSNAFAGYVEDHVKSRLDPLFQNATDDAGMEEYIRRRSICLFHGVGTASVSPKGADWGVVDPDFRVKGTVGLRIVDASVIPKVPASHPMGLIYALAERAADLIKADAGGDPLHVYDHDEGFTVHSGEYYGFNDEL